MGPMAYLGSISPSLYPIELKEAVGSQLSGVLCLESVGGPLRSSTHAWMAISWCPFCGKGPRDH